MPECREPWSIGVPGLTEAGASKLVSFARETLGSPAFTVNPRFALSVHMDAATVRPIVQALEIAGSAVEDPVAAANIAEIFRDWLATCADPEVDV